MRSKALATLLAVLFLVPLLSSCTGAMPDANRIGWLDPDRVGAPLEPLLDEYVLYVETGLDPNGEPMTENAISGRLFAVQSLRAAIDGAREAKQIAKKSAATTPEIK